MLTILQAKNFNPYFLTFDELGIQDEIVNVLEAVNGEEILGYIVFYYENEFLVVRKVECQNDQSLYDGLVRSVLFSAFNNNINKAKFFVDNYDCLIKLRFLPQNENIIHDIDKILSNCSCK